MSQYILIEKIKVQNANAVSGFTWGFPAITHFLGFVHNLSRKLKSTQELNKLSLEGCAVIAHNSYSHMFETENGLFFSQYRGTNYLESTKPADTNKPPSIIEEAKMNMTVSLLIPVDGYLGGLQEELKQFIANACQIQRLAGGTVLSIENIDIIDLAETEQLRTLRRKLLPGFVLQDRAEYLSEHFSHLKTINPKAELLDAWFDFITLKQVARPNCELIDKYLANLIKKNEQFTELNEVWLEHKSQPYQQDNIPFELIDYFLEQQKDISPKVLEQWQNYLKPNEKTSANWEYLKKPYSGYLVPIMMGYKAITEVYPAGEVNGARDIETDLCFVEAIHSIGEWQSVHRLKDKEQWQASVWNYAPYEQDWYICKQGNIESEPTLNPDVDPYA